MSWTGRFRSLLRSDRLDRDLSDELRFHVEMRTRDNLAAGMSADDARRDAERRFGNAALIKDRTRDRNVIRWLESAMQDIRYALRGLRKNPGFASVAILVLALGIGANSAMFSVVNAVMLKPLPYADSSRLLWLANYLPAFKAEIADSRNWQEWNSQKQLFENVSAIVFDDANLIQGDSPARVSVAIVSRNLFDTLGISPALGRGFTAEEDRYKGPRVAILTHALFEQRFAGDPAVLGKTVDLDDNLYTVVGVMPAGFHMPQRVDVDLLTPLALGPQSQESGLLLLDVIAKMRPGVRIDRVRSDLTALLYQHRSDAVHFQDPQVHAEILERHLVGDNRTPLLILLGAVGLVLLIACGNVANLLLGRAAARQREVAVRAALGAGQARLFRQFLTEAVLLSMAGAGLGLVLAQYTLRGVIAAGGSRVPFLDQAEIDPAVLAFTAGVALLCGLIFGTIPSMAAVRIALVEALKRGGISSTPSAAHRRFRGALVIAEIALALVLLVGAGLLVRSFWLLESIDPGFRAEHVLSVDINPLPSRYDTLQKRLAFFDDVLGRVRAIPGVESAGVYQDEYISGIFQIPGSTPARPDQGQRATWYPVSPGFFQAMGVRLKSGRLLSAQDSTDAQFAVNINATLARRYFSQGDPIGKQLKIGKVYTIVGVVDDISDQTLGAEVPAMIFIPLAQAPSIPAMHLVLRAKSDPIALGSIVRAQVSAVDRDQPISNIRTMEQKLATSIAPRRFSMILLSSFAGLALVLAVVGIYAVMFASVSERAHEVGIRMALGAKRTDVLRMIAGQGARLVVTGLLIRPYTNGTAGSWVAIFALTQIDALWRERHRSVDVHAGTGDSTLAIAMLAESDSGDSSDTRRPSDGASAGVSRISCGRRFRSTSRCCSGRTALANNPA